MNMASSDRRIERSRRQHSKVVKKAPAPNRLTLSEALVSVWRQVLVEGQSEITLGQRRYAVGFTQRKQLRTIAFSYGRRRFFGIEQNPRTESRWAALARAGEPVMQFSYKGRYIANVSEGKVFRYPAWRTLRLPE
jgi:hypothetical protein